MKNGILWRVLKQSIPTTFRLFLASTFLIYGLAKIVMGQFGTPPPEFTSIKGEGFVLAWTFFGHSRLYEVIIGLGEVIAAILLLIPKTATLGAIVFFPIAINVMLVNYCFDIGVQDLSTVLTFMCLALLWLDREKLFAIVR
ncbi:hypothetical protein [Ammoniphilus sp. CFH 90114]|uniref:hypothetical protein n=1 Tax=Ammoniphilus sp. CFH 90114 TaxID=2493665 RepID=UPI00100F7FD8|nr:hypothetical protein [Ammoniphilus sp. CFH 90114]RXT07036.1 hypothetical protein EIZ39_12830 [Ammoniphilus sp. CFH 90114]